jgi:hypothetical protein|tara:strand:+ start:199 stop:444 length:246 start_codon:yes stop_codon:yes gene_type:complete
MIKTFMLLLAFTVTDPEGEVRDEKVHVLSRHFDTQSECKEFVNDWEFMISDRGLKTVQSMLADGWKVDLTHIGCTLSPVLE